MSQQQNKRTPHVPHLSTSEAFFKPSPVQGFTSQCDTFTTIRDGKNIGEFKNGTGSVPGVPGYFSHGQRVSES